MNQREKDSKLLEAQKERKIMKSSKIIFNIEKIQSRNSMQVKTIY